MIDPDPAFRPLRWPGGYPPQEDLALLGDGTTSALVGLDGAVHWLCLPRFDSEPVFCSLLDRHRGGHFRLAPDEVVEARHHYVRDSAVLVTELRSPTGVVQVTDALALRSGADLTDLTTSARGELARCARVLDGTVRLRLELEPRGGALVQPAADGFEIRPVRRPDLALHLRADRELGALPTTVELRAGEGLELVLSWEGRGRYHRFSARELLDTTTSAWQRWMEEFSYAGPEPELVRRSAIVLKLCDYWENGALVAAPTSSLPAPVGGSRNWDYRYTWVRDAAYSVWALRRIGFTAQADAFLGWVLDAFEGSAVPMIMYDLYGGRVPDEVEDPELEGYRRSAPVRWGNGAADQRQHDLYGEVLDCAHQWSNAGGRVDPLLWARLRALVERAGEAWRTPDQGLWEVRSSGRVFTYSAALCWVALDRGVRLAERVGLPAPTERWRTMAAEVHAAVLDSWDEEHRTLSEHLGGGGSLDASLLALPLRRVVPAEHPRMVATADAIASRLSAGDGLLYRYLHGESPDGIAGSEGAFLLCSFWLVDNLAKQRRLEEANELFASLCARASPVGLLPEQIDPSDGRFLGNFPQAFSHIGVVSSGVNLALAGVRP